MLSLVVLDKVIKFNTKRKVNINTNKVLDFLIVVNYKEV